MLQNLAFTIENLTKAYRNGLSPEDVINEIFNRIKIINDQNIFINLSDLDNLHSQARDLGLYNPNMPLWGIPFAVKDNIDVNKILLLLKKANDSLCVENPPVDIVVKP